MKIKIFDLFELIVAITGWVCLYNYVLYGTRWLLAVMSLSYGILVGKSIGEFIGEAIAKRLYEKYEK